mmetsp:Transcript_2097/g.4696  ORF Transcript_2097/g.4696 Transcript_2097/m.4696 type:complete len:279 (-) Transcript_2097:1751-2587(-)
MRPQRSVFALASKPLLVASSASPTRASRMRSGTNLPRTWPSPPWRMLAGTTVPTVLLRGTSWQVSTRPLRPTIRRPPLATSVRPLPPQLPTLPSVKNERTRTGRSSKPLAGEGKPPLALPPDLVRSRPPFSTIASLARMEGAGPALPAPPDPTTTKTIGQGRKMPRPPQLVWPLLVVPPRSGRPSPPAGPTQLPPRPEGAVPVPVPGGVARSTASIRGSPPSRMSIPPRMTMDTTMPSPTRSRNLRWTRQGWTRRDSTRATKPRLNRSPHAAPRLFPT